MIHPADFRDCIVAPTLKHIGLYSLAAEQLVLGTAVHESCLIYLRQIGGGPAVGFFQMEPATHDDIWNNFLEYRPELMDKVASLAAYWPKGAAQLITNAAYACAMCRVHYYRRPEPLPEAGDGEAMGAYWKAHYNTEAGAGSAQLFTGSWEQFVKPLYN